MCQDDIPLAWLQGEVKSPPLSQEARLEAGQLLRRLQKGESLGMPHSRPMPAVGARCRELRITEVSGKWRIIYRIDPDAIVVAEVFKKKTRNTPKEVVETCKKRLRRYDSE